MSPAALLVLADGATFEGESAGWRPPDGIATGEVVFNTVLSGYQEVITDPSYAGQIIAFTYPHLGNYGVTPEDDESRRAFCRGVVTRDLTPRPSSWRARGSLDEHGPARLPASNTRLLLTSRISPSNAVISRLKLGELLLLGNEIVVRGGSQ